LPLAFGDDGLPAGRTTAVFGGGAGLFTVERGAAVRIDPVTFALVALALEAFVAPAFGEPVRGGLPAWDATCAPSVRRALRPPAPGPVSRLSTTAWAEASRLGTGVTPPLVARLFAVVVGRVWAFGESEGLIFNVVSLAWLRFRYDSRSGPWLRAGPSAGPPSGTPASGRTSLGTFESGTRGPRAGDRLGAGPRQGLQVFAGENPRL
jgi:hypothetical protein